MQAVASTQDVLRRALHEAPDLPEGFVVGAEIQTGGRGRHGRVWQMEEGDLAFSFLLRPARPLCEWPSLSLLVGLALAELTPDVRLKWPNDVVLGKAPRKCAGILCEIEGDCMVVGVGVNCVDKPGVWGVFPSADDPRTLCRSVLGRVASLYAEWSAGGFPAFRERWLARSYCCGTSITVKTGADVQAGAFEGVDERGALLLRMENGVISTVGSGELLS